MPFSPTLAEINEARLTEACRAQYAESGTLEFKVQLPTRDDRDEFLKDICSLANADGGDILYGIADNAGRAAAVRAIAGELADPARRRLGQMLDAGVEPRIAGIQLHSVAVAGGYVLVVRVPASFQGPHCFVVNGARRFVMRSGTHTADMTYEQIRMAFERTATLADRARRFRDDRTQVIAAGRTWRPMRAGPLAVVHLVPLAAIAGKTTLDIFALHENYQQFTFGYWGGSTRDTNLDGLIAHPGRDGDMRAYTQVFRNGAIETAMEVGANEVDERIIPATNVSLLVRDAITMLVAAARNLNFSGPAIFAVSLLRVAGYSFGVGGLPGMRRNLGAADREHMLLPEEWIEQVQDVNDVDAVARPLLQTLWQAFGVERCELYDANGRWNARR